MGYLLLLLQKGNLLLQNIAVVQCCLQLTAEVLNVSSDSSTCTLCFSNML